MRAFSFAPLALFTAILGCGGNVVVDKGTAAGGGGAGGGSTTSSTSTTSGTDECSGLVSTFETTFAQAISCNPFINAIQCNGTAAAIDACGCPVLANENDLKAIQAAVVAYDAAFQAACFAPCDTPCQVFGPGFCSQTGSGSTGVCMVAFPD